MDSNMKIRLWTMNALFFVGLGALFFLPIVESFNRTLGFDLLLIGTMSLSVPLLLKRISFDSVDRAWLLTLTAFALSVATSWSISRSYMEYVRYEAYFILFLSIRDISTSKEIIQKFFIGMVLGNALILGIFSFLVYIPQLSFLIPPSGMNLFFAYAAHNRISDILIFALPLSFILPISSQKGIRILARLIQGFFLVLLLISTSRGVLLALSFSLLLFVLVKKKSAIVFQKWSLLLGLSCIVFLLGGFIYSNFLTTNPEGLGRFFYRPAKDELRLVYLSQALKGFQRTPLTGSGLETFRFVSDRFKRDENDVTWYVHNHYVELFTETGVFGGTSFLVLVTILILYSKRTLETKESMTSDKFSKALFIALIASGIHSLFDFDWHFISIFLFFFIGFALLIPRPVDLTHVVSKRMTNLSILVIFISLVIPLILPLESDKALQDATKQYDFGYTDKAISILQRAKRLDPIYSLIDDRLQQFQMGIR